jgi:hypothetical protein
MKRSAIAIMAAVIVISLYFCGPARAGGMLGIALTGGMNVTNVYGDNAGSTDSKIGFLGGMSFSYMFTERLGVQIEALFHRKGYKQNLPGIELTRTLDYVEIPTLLKIVFPMESSLSPSFFSGPALAFNIRSELKTEDGGEEITEDVIDVTSPMDLGFVVGVNLGIDAGSAIIILDARYTLGLMTIDDVGETSVRNNSFSFMVGVAFPLGEAE